MSAALLDEIRAMIQQDVGNRGLARDPADNLITACRDDFAAACRSIAETPNASLAVVTGFFIPHANPPCGETDGPLGGIFLARALHPLGIPITLITDAFGRTALEVGLRACGLDQCVPVVALPEKPRRGTPDPLWTHLIALERVGPGEDGRCRNMRGLDITEHTAPAHYLFENDGPQTPPRCTIGIGDGGYEIGMGKIPLDTIRRNIPNGERIACRVATDYLIVAGVSNWGAYALAAGVAVLRGQRLPAALFAAERERELLRVMVEKGPLVDGVTARPTVSVDGLSFEDYARPLVGLGELLGSEDG
jgi:hypothetical protein